MHRKILLRYDYIIQVPRSTFLVENVYKLLLTPDGQRQSYAGIGNNKGDVSEYSNKNSHSFFLVCHFAQFEFQARVQAVSP